MIENPGFEQKYWSRTATGLYKIGHDSIRLMKWICYYDRSYYENITYYGLMGSVLKYLMNFLNGEYYVEVKDRRYKIHPTENIILRKRDQPESVRTECQVQNGTQIRRNQKVIKNNNDELIVENYPKIKQQPKFKPPNCPSCKRNNWLEFDKDYYCKNCEYIINKQKHQIDKKSSKTR